MILKNKWSWILIILIILSIAYFYFLRQNDDIKNTSEGSTWQIDIAENNIEQIDTETAQELEKANPYKEIEEKANPFKDPYQNPFE